MNEIAQRLIALRKAWHDLESVPDDLTSMGLPGKNALYIETLLGQLAHMAMKLASVPQERMEMTRRSCESALKQAESFMSADIVSYPSIRMLSFATLLQHLQTTLKSALAHAAKTSGGHSSSQVA